MEKSLQYKSRCTTALGELVMAGDEIGLTGLWFEGQAHFDPQSLASWEERELPVFAKTRQWLEEYFSGRAPAFSVPLHFLGTAFQKEVWELLCTIPYGQALTYGELAAALALRRGLAGMSARAVGGAVGRNRISILVPCHRVLGAGGKLTGYAGGLDRKIALLTLEKASGFR